MNRKWRSDPIGQILDFDSLQETSCSTDYIFKLPRSTLTKLASRDGPGLMSNSEIQSWIASNTSNNMTNGDSGDGFSWQRDNVLNDWSRSIEFAQGRLLTSKTRIRVQFLQEELLSLARHGGEL
jgi:hypothetical protein